jgi:hypothetical protein
MAIAASAPAMPNQIKQCCKIARFTDAPCINAPKHLQAIILSSDCQCPFSFLNHYRFHSWNCMFYTETLVNQTHLSPTPSVHTNLFYGIFHIYYLVTGKWQERERCMKDMKNYCSHLWHYSFILYYCHTTYYLWSEYWCLDNQGYCSWQLMMHTTRITNSSVM